MTLICSMRSVVISILAISGLVQRTEPALAQVETGAVIKAVAHYRSVHEREILQEFFGLLRLPNRATNGDDILINARHIVAMMDQRGVAARVLENDAGAPAVYGELMTPGASTTLLFYAHFDGQPTVPENWSSDPFTPVLRTDYPSRGGRDIAFADLTSPIDPDIRIFARSAGDDKAPVVGLLTALDALRANGIAPSVNIKFFFEGEEEAGSPSLKRMLARYGHLLATDVMVFCDGPVHQSGNKQLSFGVRGVVDFGITVYGPDRPLHSGHYGNFAPNPIVMLSHLIASMRDENSHILVDGVYDAVLPPSAAELAAIANLPPVEEDLRKELAIGRQESVGHRYNESILWPALNVRGIRAGEVGDKARNIIVTSATAAFGYRLVPNQTPEMLRELTERHLRAQGYHVVYEDPDAETRRAHPKVAKFTWAPLGYPAVRTPIDHPAVQAMIETVEAVEDGPVHLVPGMGGSLPIWYFQERLGAPLISLPIANYDNNQHAEDENIRIGNLWDGISLYGVIFATFSNVYRP